MEDFERDPNDSDSSEEVHYVKKINYMEILHDDDPEDHVDE